MRRIEKRATGIVAQYSADFPQAGIEIEIFNEYPALDTPADASVRGCGAGGTDGSAMSSLPGQSGAGSSWQFKLPSRQIARPSAMIVGAATIQQISPGG